MALTDTAIRKAKPAAKPRRLVRRRRPVSASLIRAGSQAGGASSIASAARKNGLSLGTYPDTGLGDRAREARRRAQAARELESIPRAAQGRKAREGRRSRGQQLRSCRARMVRQAIAPAGPRVTPSKIIRRFERDLFPWIGSTPDRQHRTAPELLRVLRGSRIAARSKRRIAPCRTAGQVFRYAIATGRAAARPVRRPARRAVSVRGRFTSPAITEPAKRRRTAARHRRLRAADLIDAARAAMVSP